MPTVWGIYDGNALRPYRKFQDTLGDFQDGERLRIKVERDRGGKFNALYHVMIDLIVKAVNRGPATTSIKEMKNWVKLKKGWYEIKPLPAPAPDGQTSAIEYKSTSFASMGEEEFHAFAVDTCELLAAELAPWIKDSPEWLEAKQIIDTIKPEAAQ